MAESENILLQRFVKGGDATAFSEIVRRHAGLVYGACVRVLGDADRAADATQETFFQFLRDAGRITGSLPNWLHRVAMGKAVDVVRKDSSRQRREAEYADLKQRQVGEWKELSPYVDQALDALDDEEREMLIRYFFEGRSMAEIAAAKGISHPTVSRRIEKGIGELHAQLRRRGLIVAGAALTSLLGQNAAQAAPASVLQELAKMALAGGKGTAAATAGAAATGSAAAVIGLAAAAKTKLIAAAAVIVLGLGGTLAYKYVNRPAENSSPDTGAGAAGVSEHQQAAQPVVEPTARSDEMATPPADNDVQAQRATPPVKAAGIQQSTGALPPGQTKPPSETTAGTRSSQIDLSSPEATVRSFTRLMATGNAEAVMACFLPGGIDYQDMQEILAADPSDPRQRNKYETRMWLQSFDPEAKMPIIETKQKADGVVEITWEVVFKKDLTMEGQTFTAGQTMNLDAQLVKSDGKWLINGL